MTLEQKRALKRCNLSALPAPIGDLDGERCSGLMVCSICGQQYYDHPVDDRILGYDGIAYLHITCAGLRVKL